MNATKNERPEWGAFLTANPATPKFRMSSNVAEGKHLTLQTAYYALPNGKNVPYERVVRNKVSEIVSALVVTESNEIVLLKQYRYPLDRWIIEMPAGLVDEGETAESAVCREIEEEAGYACESPVKLFDTPTSSGLTNEVVQVYVARNAKKISDVLGAVGESEQIDRIVLPEESVEAFLGYARRLGWLIDSKVFAALALWRSDFQD